MTLIHYSDGTARVSVIEIREDLHNERSGYYRAFWAEVLPDGELGGGSPVVGYCSPGGSHRTIQAAMAEALRHYPGEAVYRLGRILHPSIEEC
jgi:hypothetical protein